MNPAGIGSTLNGLYVIAFLALILVGAQQLSPSPPHENSRFSIPANDSVPAGAVAPSVISESPILSESGEAAIPSPVAEPGLDPSLEQVPEEMESPSPPLPEHTVPPTPINVPSPFKEEPNPDSVSPNSDPFSEEPPAPPVGEYDSILWKVACAGEYHPENEDSFSLSLRAPAGYFFGTTISSAQHSLIPTISCLPEAGELVLEPDHIQLNGRKGAPNGCDGFTAELAAPYVLLSLEALHPADANWTIYYAGPISVTGSRIASFEITPEEAMTLPYLFSIEVLNQRACLLWATEGIE